MDKDPLRELKKILFLIFFFCLFMVWMALVQSGRINLLIALVLFFSLLALLLSIIFFDTSIRKIF